MIECCPKCRSIEIEDIGGEYQCNDCLICFTEDGKVIRDPNKEDEQKVVDIVNSCKVYRKTFIIKKELIKKLEEAFPEK